MPRLTVQRAALAALALVVASGAGAAPAGAVAVDVDPGGRAELAVWGGPASPFVRLRSQAAGGALGTLQTVSPGYGHEDVQAGPGGTATIMWVQQADDGRWTLRTRRRAADGTLRPAQVVAPDLALADGVPVMAADDEGGAYFAWVETAGGKPLVRGRRRRPDGTLSAAQSFGSGFFPQRAPQVAADRDGSYVVMWQRGVGEEIQARRRLADGTLAPTQRLSPPGDSVGVPRLATAADGHAVFAWVNRSRGWAQARIRRPDGTLGAVTDVWPYASPEVAIAPGGVATVAGVGPNGGASIVQVKLAGRMPPPQSLSSNPDGQDANVRVVVDPDGNSVAAWHELGLVAGGPARLMTRRLLPDGRKGAEAVVATGTSAGADAGAPADVDVDAAGTATYLWRDADAASYTRRRGAGGARTPIVKVSG